MDLLPMADLHTHALIPMYYYRKKLATPQPHPLFLPWGPIGTHIDIPGIKASGVKLITFCVYAFNRLPRSNCFENAKAQIRVFETWVSAHSDVLAHAKTPSEIQPIIQSGRTAAILALEGGHHIGNDLENVAYFKSKGIFYVTMVHFINTPVGDTFLTGAFSSNRGLRPFGRELLRTLEDQGMIVDVAHASETGFWDMLEQARKPPIFSHGACRTVCGHSRNLSDEQSREMIKKGGLMGIILYPHYLRRTAVWGRMEDVTGHIDHWLSLGGENTVSIGSDMSGTMTLREIGDISGMPRLHDALVKRYGESVARKILFDNAMGYLERHWPGAT